jgi:hypothetical protein
MEVASWEARNEAEARSERTSGAERRKRIEYTFSFNGGWK